MLNAQCSMLNAQCSMFNDKCSTRAFPCALRPYEDTAPHIGQQAKLASDAVRKAKLSQSPSETMAHSRCSLSA